MIDSPRSLALLATASLLLLATPQAGAEWRVFLPSSGQAAGDTLTIAQAGQSWELDYQGRRTALPLGKTSRITDLRSAGAGWVLAATETTAAGERLVLLRGNGRQVETLPSPTVAAGSTLLQPNPLTNAEGLAALLWIEGVDARQGAVKFARWLGAGWSAPETIALPGPGTQTALRALTLNDRSYLAVWSAFDGEDDEIVWSRFDGARWSPPESVTTNQVPDVTPAITTTDRGALLVWSFYDGNDYRLQAAAWRGNGFEATQIFGGKGSTFPTFAEKPSGRGGAIVVARQAVPTAWQIVELDEGGKSLRWAELPADDRRPPQILEADASRVLIQGKSPETPISLAWNAFAE